MAFWWKCHWQMWNQESFRAKKLDVVWRIRNFFDKGFDSAGWLMSPAGPFWTSKSSFRPVRWESLPSGEEGLHISSAGRIKCMKCNMKCYKMKSHDVNLQKRILQHEWNAICGEFNHLTGTIRTISCSPELSKCQTFDLRRVQDRPSSHMIDLCNLYLGPERIHSCREFIQIIWIPMIPFHIRMRLGLPKRRPNGGDKMSWGSHIFRFCDLQVIGDVAISQRMVAFWAAPKGNVRHVDNMSHEFMIS